MQDCGVVCFNSVSHSFNPQHTSIVDLVPDHGEAATAMKRDNVLCLLPPNDTDHWGDGAMDVSCVGNEVEHSTISVALKQA